MNVMTPNDTSWLDALTQRIAEPKKFDKPEYHKQYDRGKKTARKKFKIDHIGLLDFETDPFDNGDPDTLIEPFICCVYYDGNHYIFQDDNHSKLIDQIFAHIEALDEPWVFYAHNGGKFDYRFLEYKLRGRVGYKGSSLMRAEIGKCEIRDSLHILPIALKEFNKEKFEYWKMKKKHRHKHMAEIIEYVKSDCENTLKLIRKFIDKNGFKISIGAAALSALQKDYEIEHVSPSMDEKLRPYFRGGRVECLAGQGYFEGKFTYYDVNSMYPAVMAYQRHPIGSQYIFGQGEPNDDTFFLTIECDNNGALLAYNEQTHELTSEIEHGIFRTTIYEYRMALELGLIENVKIIECVDCLKSSTFEKFVIPRYETRQKTKHELKELKKIGQEGTEHWYDVHGEDLLTKLELNNAYGKTAQNPRKFKEYVFTDPLEEPDKEKYGTGWMQEVANSDYWMWTRPNPDIRFLNVGTGASITGAARAKLLQAKHAAINPLYCDTDSLICEELPGLEIDDEKLGAWKVEAIITKLIVAGKKLYAYEKDDGSKKFRSKGTGDWSWNEMLILIGQGDVFDIRATAGYTLEQCQEMARNRTIIKKSRAPTLYKGGGQDYLARTVRATARSRHA